MKNLQFNEIFKLCKDLNGNEKVLKIKIILSNVKFIYLFKFELFTGNVCAFVWLRVFSHASYKRMMLEIVDCKRCTI